MSGKQVTFVCTGNQCRSPMAEYLLRSRIGESAGWIVGSAGTCAPDGCPASERACGAMMELGIDMSGHQSSFLSDEMIDGTTIIVAMCGSHRDEIVKRKPEAEQKTFLMRSFGNAGRAGDIDDPVGLSVDTYRTTRDMIDAHMSDLILFLKQYEESAIFPGSTESQS